MKVTKLFVPDRDLTDKIKEYIEGSSLPERINQLHEDPNLSYVVPSVIIASGIPNHCRLTVAGALEIGMRKRLAFEFDSPTGNKVLVLDKSTGKTVLMFDNHPSEEIEMKNIPPMEILRIIQKFVKISESKKEKCMYARDFLEVLEDFPSDYINYQELNKEKENYFEKIKIDLIDASFDEPHTIKNSIMDYVHMAQAMWLHKMEHDDVWEYKDPLTKTSKSIKIKGRYVFAVEERLGHNTESQKDEFRKKINILYSQQVIKNPGYDFMDDSELVNAVIDVKLESDVLGTGSLIGALTSRTDEENRQFYNKVINNIIKNSNYCKSCAKKTLEHFCIPQGL